LQAIANKRRIASFRVDAAGHFAVLFFCSCSLASCPM
jgi:hypothetical protein